MKNLSLKITSIIIGVVLLSCEINQMEKNEIDDLISNDLEVITERTVYKGKSYVLSYSVNEDSTLNFMDSKSEENYSFCFQI